MGRQERLTPVAADGPLRGPPLNRSVGWQEDEHSPGFL